MAGWSIFDVQYGDMGTWNAYCQKVRTKQQSVPVADDRH